MPTLLRDSYERSLGVSEPKTSSSRVLRTLVGPMMEAGVKNNNGRVYSKRCIVDKILNHPEVKTRMESKALFGEGDHPEKRINSSYPQVSHAIRDLWMEGDTLMGKWDILDTPAGQILNTLVEYGAPIGASARGQGDVNIREGTEYIDESSYDFVTFDAVVNPSFSKSLLLQESEGTNTRKKLVEAVSVHLDHLTDVEAKNGARLFLEGVQPEVYSELFGPVASDKDPSDEPDYKKLYMELLPSFNQLAIAVIDGKVPPTGDTDVVLTTSEIPVDFESTSPNQKKIEDALHRRFMKIRSLERRVEESRKTVFDLRRQLSEAQRQNKKLEESARRLKESYRRSQGDLVTAREELSYLQEAYNAQVNPGPMLRLSESVERRVPKQPLREAAAPRRIEMGVRTPVKATSLNTPKEEAGLVRLLESLPSSKKPINS